MLDTILDDYPKEIALKGALNCTLRPLETSDEAATLEFFRAVPQQERLFIKHDINDPETIRRWCQDLDYEHFLPLLAVADGKILADAVLHQHQGGWRRHIGRVSVLVHPGFRGRGLARAMIEEIMNIARGAGLERIEAEFIDEQETAMRLFGRLGFTQLFKLPDYVKDMQGLVHDYVLMGAELLTDEEYAGVGG
jgi:GNAT superfamily N-acetyltransferase